MPRVKHLENHDPTQSLASGATALSSASTVKQLRELAEVMAYSASQNSYDVITRGAPGCPKQPGGKPLKDIALKTSNPGSAAPIPVGTTVVIDWSLGFPYISGTLPVNAYQPAGFAAETVGGGTSSIATPQDNTKQEHSAYYRNPDLPKDIMAGDQLLITPDGNKIGALRGNYSVMDSGPASKAKIETFGGQDLIRLTTENYELNTAFGIMQVFNDGGRCGVILRGGADQLTESGGDEEQWTFKLDIGDTGDYFTMEVCTAEGATKAKVNMSSSGRVTILATDGVDIVDGGKSASHNEYASNLITRILGSVKEIVAGPVTETYQSTRSTTVSETDKKMVGHNESTSVNNHQITTVGGNQQIQVSGGGPLFAKPDNIAVDMQVLNGSYSLELGNPLAGGSPAAMAGFTVSVNNGDITLGQNPDILALPAIKATVSLNTTLPNSIALGGTTSLASKNPALLHAVLGEPLQTLLSAMMASFDAHTHVPPVGGPPAAPMSVTLATLLATVLSQRVLIGA